MKHLRLLLTLCVISASAYLVYNHSPRWFAPQPTTVVQPEQPQVVMPPPTEQEEAAQTQTPSEPSPSNQVVLNAHTEQAVVTPKTPKVTKVPEIADVPKAAKASVVAEAPKVVEKVKPAELTQVVQAPKTVDAIKPVEASKTVEAPQTPLDAKPVEVAKPVEPPKVSVAPKASLPIKETAKEIQLTIKEIKFTGVTLVPEKELSKTVSEFVGKELTVQEAFAIPAKVTNHYKRNNHMAIATLVGALTPEGVLTVGVTEMQMTQSQAEKELATLAPVVTPVAASSTAPAPAAVAAAPSSPEMKVLPPRETVANKVPLPTQKSADSETDYILKNYAQKSRQYELMIDNYGPEATGSTRVGAALSIGGDQLSLVGFKSHGSEYLRMAVNWITGIDGLKVGAHVSTLKYEVVNHLQTAMYQSGDAVKRGVSLIYELVNETSHYSTLALKFDSKSTNAVGLNFADSTAFQSWVSNLEYKGIVREMIPGGAVFSYDLSYAQGHVDVTGATNIGGIEVDEGPFSKLRFTGSINQPLGGLGSVFAGLTLQRSRKNLDPSERFYLGGPTGVRAYGVGEGYGSEGELATLEFRQRLTASTVLSEFYDWGRARLTHDHAAANNITTLSGYGISLSQEVGSGTTVKGTWARSHGNNTPLPTNPNGSDNVDRNRFWLSMETRF